MGKKEIIGKTLLVIIFGSGLVLYVWNMAHGKNSAVPPTFDLSAYDTAMPKIVADPDVAAKDAPSAEPDKKEFVLEKNKLYFKKSFRAMTAAGTQKMIADFLKDFPSLKALPFEDFEAKSKIQFSFRPEDKSALLDAMKNAVFVSKYSELPDNQLEVELDEPIYLDELKSVLPRFELMIVLTDFSNSSDYIGKLNYQDAVGKESDLEKIKKDFADLVVVN